SAGGYWDEHRNARLQKPQPKGDRLLRLESIGRAGGEFGIGQAVDGLRVMYALEFEGNVEILEDVQWADWDSQGQLLTATRSGKLQVRALQKRSFKVAFETDLALLAPEPTEAPDWANRW
ncbi:MAG: hypothetical protein WCD18_20750, partial [Thermosynechococcaceae cyanobacterium]